jgi:hypothetical protein
LIVLLVGWVASRPGAVRSAREQVRVIEDWIDPTPDNCVMGEPIWIPPPTPDDEDDE